VARLLMSDEEWAVFQPFLISSTGCPPKGHRRVLDGIFWITRTGAGWRDLPAEFGKCNSVWRQFRRWALSGVFDIMLEGFAHSGADAEMLQMIDSTVIRAHRCAAGKRNGVQHQALGRSRGGFSTKVHLRVNADGMPIAVEATPGQAHDVTAYDDLMDQRDSDPGALLADKGYDSDAIRQDLRDRGASPEIPTKRNRTVRYAVEKALYAVRARVEHCIGHLKEQRRITTRYDKTQTSFVGFVLLGCLRSWFRFVHRA
jgi:transposase